MLHRRPELAALLLLVLAGCRGTGAKDALELHAHGRHVEAAEKVRGAKSPGDRDNVLFYLEKGKILQDAGCWEESARALEVAIRLMEGIDYLAVVDVGRTVTEVGALLADERVRDYDGTLTDRILAESAQALNYAMLGRLEEAAVHVRRQLEQQQKALEAHEQLESRLESQVGGKGSAPARSGQLSGGGERRAAATASVTLALRDVHFAGIVQSGDYVQRQQALSRLVESDYVPYSVPWGYYLGTILMLAAGKEGEARELARELGARSAGNPYADELAEDPRLDGRVFVLFENGLAPVLRDDSFLFASPLGLSRVPIPALEPRLEGRAERLIATVGGQELPTVQLDRVDEMVAADFRDRMPWTWFRTILAVVSKEVMSKQLQDEHLLAGLVTGSLWKLSAQADTRLWRSLPGEHHVAHFPRPEDGALRLRLAGTQLGPGGSAGELEVSLPGEAGPVLVFVRSTGRGALAAHAALLRPGGAPTAPTSPAPEPADPQTLP